MSITSTITTKSPGFAYVNTTPALFCVPGHPINSIVSREGIDTIVPWPRGSQLSYSIILRKESKTPEFAMGIIKEAIAEWFSSLEKTLEIREARDGELADIRISFRTDMPSWSYIGAVAAESDRSEREPTMNFNFGGWKSSKAVYSHASIKRLALHLFGHALGLPHAKLNQWPLSWKKDELKRECGSFNAELLNDAKGCDQLQDPESIMHYDVPARLVNGRTDIRQGGCFIDQGARSLVQSLYPPALEASFFELDTLQHPDFEHTAQTSRPSALVSAKLKPTHTANIVTGIRKMDIGIDDNFRVGANIYGGIPGPGYSVILGTWGKTYLNAAICNVLCFDAKDEKIQTGSALWDSHSNGNERSVRQTFKRPFIKTPDVVVFISSFDSDKDKFVRIDVAASDIDKNGFTVNMRTWDDSAINSLGVFWVAHEPDEWSIRSGSLDIEFEQEPTRSKCCKTYYTNPMPRQPTKLFYAFSHIDVQPTKNLRLDLYATCDETKVDAEFNTWGDEEGFMLCKGCYVAVF